MQGSISVSHPQTHHEQGMSFTSSLYHVTNLLVFNISIGFLHSEFGLLTLPLAAWGVLSLAVLAFLLPQLINAPFPAVKIQRAGFAVIYALIILAADMQHGLSFAMLTVLGTVAVSAWFAPSRLQLTSKAVVLACMLSTGLVLLPVGMI